ncbi:hypothetical protein PoB_005263000 [Plakobranchus ocellatus]|uniref:Uncharacterized protein n=1 Tax=Plakobranchus ocellatus TaxID=259542 RepID=A0AAV4C0E0_9GAST|nr:hypothetical protein PoB_005263000 [Plakobranchus ocellatus]
MDFTTAQAITLNSSNEDFGSNVSAVTGDGNVLSVMATTLMGQLEEITLSPPEVPEVQPEVNPPFRRCTTYCDIPFSVGMRYIYVFSVIVRPSIAIFGKYYSYRECFSKEIGL